ncbi:MAG: hypothetical protein M5U15_13720 [Kiritimatiellae bacterium]|nr:hypothetical protein [Kiritimatiellia bacterium]
MLKELQERIVEHIKRDPLFADVTVVAAVKGRIADEIEKALGSLGLLVVVEPLRGPLRHVGGRISTEPQFEVNVMENVTLNRARASFATADDLTERICWLLRGGQTPPPPIFAVGWELASDLDENFGYRVEAKTREPLELSP